MAEQLSKFSDCSQRLLRWENTKGNLLIPKMQYTGKVLHPKMHNNMKKQQIQDQMTWVTVFWQTKETPL